MPIRISLSPSYPQPAPFRNVLRRLTQQELEELDDFDEYGCGNHYHTQVPIDDIDDPYPFRFAFNETVWVRMTSGEWVKGYVSEQHARMGSIAEGEGLYYLVTFSPNNKCRMRKYFAPLNGDVKPDIRIVRRLLVRGEHIDKRDLFSITS